MKKKILSEKGKAWGRPQKEPHSSAAPRRTSPPSFTSPLDLFSMCSRPWPLFEKRPVLTTLKVSNVKTQKTQFSQEFRSKILHESICFDFFLQFNAKQCFQKCIVELLFHFWQFSLKIRYIKMEITIKSWIKVYLSIFEIKI